MRRFFDWKFWLGLCLSVLLLYLAVRKVNVSMIGQALKQVQYSFLIPVIVLVVFSFWLRAYRWRFLLEPIQSIPMASMFSATMIGFMANNIFPARLGEFLKAYAIHRKSGVGKSASFATIVVERVFDGITLLFMLSLVFLMWRYSFPAWVKKVSLFAMAVYIVALIVLIVLKLQTRRTMRIIQFALKPFPDRISEGVVRISHSFIRGLDILHTPKNIGIAAILSLAIWMLNALVVHLQLIAFRISLPFHASVLLIILIAFGVMIPSAPGYVGTIQFLCVAGLAIFGIAKPEALSFSLVFHATQYIPVTAIGAVYFLIEGFSFSVIEKAGGVPEGS